MSRSNLYISKKENGGYSGIRTRTTEILSFVTLPLV